ncbi:hypothetical protein N6L27_15160 [Leisingera sp. SS27]|uniref:hypothetical protein n=1 Tax=Leisingera sp. SS27 TaxID=2979462 RepID=UPI0023309675|nr:hypothetical protein [Leisingera sp. SS27]MDC0659342.1 hypothetical protein [Leisingera sp. SS27]
MVASTLAAVVFHLASAGFGWPERAAGVSVSFPAAVSPLAAGAAWGVVLSRVIFVISFRIDDIARRVENEDLLFESDHREHLLGLAGHTGDNLALDCRRQFLTLLLQGSESELRGFPIRFCLLPQNLGNFGLVSEENRLFNFLAKAQPKGQLAFAGDCHLLFDFYFAAEPSRGMRQLPN